jgi:hypothetical protein
LFIPRSLCSLDKQAKHFPNHIVDRSCSLIGLGLEEATLAFPEGSEEAEKLVRQVTNQLTTAFGAGFAPETIEGVVTESLESFGQTRVRTYLPLLVQRRARQRLIATLPAAEGSNEVA